MIMPIILHIRKKKMGLKFLVFGLLLLLNLAFVTAKAEVLQTMNVSMPTNYGTFFGEIHYASKDLPLALRVERIIKEDLIKTINYFEYVPYDVVHFNIDPYTRLTNGNARTFPTNIINLYNFPASNSEHLIAMENWMQGLVFHEFIHITHLDQTQNYMEIGRRIFGTAAKIPAAIVPRWFTEGIAVWGESHLINGGRLNNKLFNKELLLQFKKENFCKTIDCLDTPGAFPNGQLAYWAGAHFMEYLENLKPKTIKCLVEFNSGELPFFLNNAFEACAGEKAQDLYSKFRDDFIKKGNMEVIPASKKITNAFGSDDFQKGYVLERDRLFKVEQNKFSESLVAYDLKDDVNYIGQFDAPIASIAGMVDVDNENKMLLVAFNDDGSGRIADKTWKLIDPDSLLVERKLDFPHDPSYVVSLGGESYLTFSYWENSWRAERGSDVLRVFPAQYNIVIVKKLGEQILLKINDADGVSSIVLTDLKLQNLNLLYKSDKYFDLPVITDKFFVIRNGEEFKLVELDFKNQISTISKKFFEQVTTASFNEERMVILQDGLVTEEKTLSESEQIFKKDKTETQVLAPNEFKLIPAPNSSFSSTSAESYPRLDHLIPHWWFIAFGSSDNLSSIGALTSFVDPMEVHSLDATVLAFPSVTKVGGTLDYTQKLVSVSDLWSVSAYAKKDYYKASFNSDLNSSFDFQLSTRYQFLYRKWSYTPSLYVESVTTDDFISKRTIQDVGVSNTFIYQALTYDDFIQYFIGRANLQFDKADFGNGYMYSFMQAETGVRLNQDFTGSLKGSYSKLFKSDFTRGVVYGGGLSDSNKTRSHEFYGIPYSNAYGNDVFTTRLMFDYNFWNIYRAKNLIPFFFKELHMLVGTEGMYADRIFLDGNILRNRMINSIFIGPRLKMNWFYYVPVNIDLIFSKIASPVGKDVNQAEFLLTAGAF